MIFQYFILNAILASLTIASVDHQAPVFTYCPKCITMKEITEPQTRVDWSKPKATDDSGEEPEIICSRPSGDLFPVPSTTEVVCMARDSAGNKANCSFRVTLKRKECPMFDPPQNGALACNKIGVEYVCAAMCQNDFDFTFNPPLLYYCSSGQWKFYGIPSLPYSTQLPWPNCSRTANPSILKLFNLPGYFFDGDINDPNVLQSVKVNFMNLATSPFIPPFFCTEKPDECNVKRVEVYHK